MTILEMLRLKPEIRKNINMSSTLSQFSLDNEVYTGYNAFSFFWEFTYPNEPERSLGGVIDLTNNAYFVTPHLKIDFSLMSYNDFMRLRIQQLSKKTFTLKCHDTDFDQELEREVYFSPDTLPNFLTVGRTIGGEKYTELFGAKKYTVELIGTNRNVTKNYITYFANIPTGYESSTAIAKPYSTYTYNPKSAVKVGYDVYFLAKTGSKLSTGSFVTGKTLKGWSTDPMATTAQYAVNAEITFNQSNPVVLYAVWG